MVPNFISLSNRVTIPNLEKFLVVISALARFAVSFGVHRKIAEIVTRVTQKDR